MLPSPTDLKYFQEVARLGNLSHAARRLGVSQPALTLAIRRVETSFGVPLFIRCKRGVSLTKAGKQILVHSHQLNQLWDTLKAKALSTNYEMQGTFSIGCHPSVAQVLAPSFMPKLLTHHPKLEIKLVHDLSRNITEQVLSSTIDIGISVNPFKHPDLIMKKLLDDKVTLWKSDKLNLSEDTMVLICDPDLIQTQAILKKLKKTRWHFPRLVTSSNLEVIARLTESGAGIGILPTRVASPFAIQAIPNAPYFHDEFYLMYRGENRHVKGIQMIAGAIKEARL